MEENQTIIAVNAQDDNESHLRKLIKEGILVLTPTLSKQMIHYADAEETWKVDSAKAKRVITRLVEEGLLKSEFADHVLVCPKCGSPEVHSKYTCPKCGAYDVEFTELVEHKKCGNIGSKESFTKGSSLVCPHCQVELTRETSDYRIIGNFYECSKCGHRFDKPEVTHICQNCGANSTYRDAKYIKTFAYRVAEGAMKVFQAELPVLGNIKRILLDKGFKAQLHAKVTGTSGVQSPVDVLADRGKVRLIIDISTTGNKNDIIALLAKKVDVNPTSAMIVDLSASDELTSMGKVFGITVFKSESDQNLPSSFGSFVRLLGEGDIHRKPHGRGE